jgi:hypothetical protein
MTFALNLHLILTAIVRRKLRNNDIHNLYSIPNIIRAIKSGRIKLALHVARMKAMGNLSRILVRKPEGKGPLGRPKRK